MQRVFHLGLVLATLISLACSSKNSNSCTGDPTMCECTPGGNDCPAGYTCNPASMLCVANGGADASVVDAARIFDARLTPADASTPDASTTDTGTGPAVDTTIVSGPALDGNVPAVTFVFTATLTGSTFECRILPAAFAPCTSPFMTTLTDGMYTFQVQATSPGGSVDPTPAAYMFTIDTMSPDTTIVSGTTGTVTDTTASFVFTSTEAGSTFTCQIDSAPAAPCTSGEVFSGLGLGMHTITVTAIDPAGNVDPTPATATWTVTEVVPDTFIDIHPDAVVDSTTALFQFHSDQDGATFQCSLDNMPYVTCVSPLTYSNLTAGPHSFKVRAVSAGGTQTDPTPAIILWTIDQSGLVTSITSGGEGGIGCATTTFTFGATGMNLTFVCTFDGSPVAACNPAGTTFMNLQDGTTHTFSVHTVDAQGNMGPPVSVTFVVDATAPMLVITSPMNGGLTNASTILSFATEATAIITCTLDGAALADCVSGMHLPTLTNGSHTVTVDAADRCNHTDASSTWTADTIPPVVTITGPAPGSENAAQGTIFYNPDGAVVLTCTFDGHPVTCSTNGLYTYSAGAGPHTFTVQGVDAAGNASNVATLTFNVDGDPPIVTGIQVTDSSYGTLSFTTELTDDSNITEIHCVVDGVDHPCGAGPSGSITLEGIGHGAHTIAVYGVDEFGNSGQPVAISQAPSPHVGTSAQEQLEGHLIGIGDGYVLFGGVVTDDGGPTSSMDTFDAIMANAVTATQVYPTRTPRILGYAVNPDPTACNNVLAAIADKLGGSGSCNSIGGFPWYRQLSDPDLLASELASADVFLIHDMGSADTATALYPSWRQPLLDFLNSGGVVVFYDGTGEDGPHQTWCTLRECDTNILPQHSSWFPFEQDEPILRIAMTENVGGGFPLMISQPEDVVARGLDITSFQSPMLFTTTESGNTFGNVQAFHIADVVSEVVEPYGYYPGAFHDRKANLEGDLYGGSGNSHEIAPHVNGGPPVPSKITNVLTLWNRDQTWHDYPVSTSYAVVFDKPFPDPVRVEVRSQMNGGSYIYNAPVAFQNSRGETIVRHTGHDGAVVQSLIGGGTITAGTTNSKGVDHRLTTYFGVQPLDTLLVLNVPAEPVITPDPDALNVDFGVLDSFPAGMATPTSGAPIFNVSIGSVNGSTQTFPVPANLADGVDSAEFTQFGCVVDTDTLEVDVVATLQDGPGGPVLAYAYTSGTVGGDDAQLPDLSTWSIPDQTRTLDASFNGSNIEYRITQDRHAACNPNATEFGSVPPNGAYNGATSYSLIGNLSYDELASQGQLFSPYDAQAIDYFTGMSNTDTYTERLIVHNPAGGPGASVWISRFAKGSLPDDPVAAMEGNLLPFLTNGTATLAAQPQVSFTASGSIADVDGGYAQIKWAGRTDDHHQWNFVFPAETSFTAPQLPADFNGYLPTSSTGDYALTNISLVKSPLLQPAPWADIPYAYPPPTSTSYDSFRFAYPVVLTNLALNPSDTTDTPPPGEVLFSNSFYATYLDTTSSSFVMP